MSDDNSMFDKIIEFGMGMTVAKQIPQMMDMAMSQCQTTATPPDIKTDSANVYIVNNGQQAGPFSEAETKQLIKNGILTPLTMVWMPKMPQWMPASQVPAINKLLLLNRMVTPSSANNPQVVPKPIAENPIRDEVVAAIGQLGYSNANTRKIIDEVISQNPNISSADAIKEVLKRL